VKGQSERGREGPMLTEAFVDIRNPYKYTCTSLGRHKMERNQFKQMADSGKFSRSRLLPVLIE
jgi:hypothetical protein